jgi:hypothetical protein
MKIDVLWVFHFWQAQLGGAFAQSASHIFKTLLSVKVFFHYKKFGIHIKNNSSFCKMVSCGWNDLQGPLKMKER